MKCQYCESEAILPFKCAFCGGYFCAEHRLPEKHECPEILNALQRRDEQQANVKDALNSQGQYHDYRIPTHRLNAKVFGASTSELKHLTIGTLIVISVGFSILYNLGLEARDPWRALIGSALVFTSTFVLHEIAHKVAAQHYGLWAEFRLTLFGSLLTLLSIISPLKIISPGVVQMAGVADKKTIGKVSLAGPATNLILSIIFLSLSHYIGNPFVAVGAILNPWTALFNLVPFSVFDGEKIFWWDKKVWVASFAASVIFTYFALRLFFTFP